MGRPSNGLFVSLLPSALNVNLKKPLNNRTPVDATVVRNVHDTNRCQPLSTSSRAKRKWPDVANRVAKNYGSYTVAGDHRWSAERVLCCRTQHRHHVGDPTHDPLGSKLVVFLMGFFPGGQNLYQLVNG